MSWPHSLTGCWSPLVSIAHQALLCACSTSHDLFPTSSVHSADLYQSCVLRRGCLSGTPFVWTGQARPVSLFISLKLPGQRTYLRNSFFSKIFFLPLRTFCLRENEMSIFCFLIFFQESKGLLTSSLSPPFLPSSRRYSSEKKRTKYCSCSLS